MLIKFFYINTKRDYIIKKNKVYKNLYNQKVMFKTQI